MPDKLFRRFVLMQVMHVMHSRGSLGSCRVKAREFAEHHHGREESCEVAQEVSRGGQMDMETTRRGDKGNRRRERTDREQRGSASLFRFFAGSGGKHCGASRVGAGACVGEPRLGSTSLREVKESAGSGQAVGIG